MYSRGASSITRAVQSFCKHGLYRASDLRGDMTEQGASAGKAWGTDLYRQIIDDLNHIGTRVPAYLDHARSLLFEAGAQDSDELAVLEEAKALLSEILSSALPPPFGLRPGESTWVPGRSPT